MNKVNLPTVVVGNTFKISDHKLKKVKFVYSTNPLETLKNKSIV